MGEINPDGSGARLRAMSWRTRCCRRRADDAGQSDGPNYLGRRRRMIGSQLKGGGRTGRRDVVEGDQRRGYLTGTHTNETGRGWHSRSVIRNMQARR